MDLDRDDQIIRRHLEFFTAKLVESDAPFLGSGKWSVGPTAIVLEQSGSWTYGFLANHLWSIAGATCRGQHWTTVVARWRRLDVDGLGAATVYWLLFTVHCSLFTVYRPLATPAPLPHIDQIEKAIMNRNER